MVFRNFGKVFWKKVFLEILENFLEIWKTFRNFGKLRNFGNFKSSEFLHTQILPEISTSTTSIDLGGKYDVYLNNIYLYKSSESFKTFLPKPHRRESRFKSLKHKSNSSIGNKWVHNETRKNQLKYYNQVRTNIDDFRIDGINTLRFKEVKKEENGIISKISIEL